MCLFEFHLKRQAYYLLQGRLCGAEAARDRIFVYLPMSCACDTVDDGLSEAEYSERLKYSSRSDLKTRT